MCLCAQRRVNSFSSSLCLPVSVSQPKLTFHCTFLFISLCDESNFMSTIQWPQKWHKLCSVPFKKEHHIGNDLFWWIFHRVASLRVSFYTLQTHTLATKKANEHFHHFYPWSKIQLIKNTIKDFSAQFNETIVILHDMNIHDDNVTLLFHKKYSNLKLKRLETNVSHCYLKQTQKGHLWPMMYCRHRIEQNKMPVMS